MSEDSAGSELGLKQFCLMSWEGLFGGAHPEKKARPISSLRMRSGTLISSLLPAS